ncbi:tetratricopeptide repeat protein [Flavobacterium adhaerens]|uniref:tetratricopeptide repeat protein n=1 Tax=Flavobacterium adhaerens TaxID=3149043 RepID=UPI0032B59032
MKKIFLHIALFFSLICFSQNEQLAQYYFEKGDFEKALVSFKELSDALPSNPLYFQRKIECMQQLLQFETAEKEIQNRLSKYKFSPLLIELGYNYQLQKNDTKAKKYYDEAIDKIRKTPNEVYSVANTFEKKILLEYALKSYLLASEIVPTYDFKYQTALLYGQLGNNEQMIANLLDVAFENQQSTVMMQNQLLRYMSSEGDSKFNDSLKKTLILRVQKNQDIYWNQFLSWFYMQQKEFGKAFIQEKAIYKRNPESLTNIISLGQMAIEEKENEVAKEVMDYVLANTSDVNVIVQANTYLLQMKIDKAQPNQYADISTQFDALLQQYGFSPTTLPLLLKQAHFESFVMRNPTHGKVIIKKAMEMQLNQFDQAKCKMELADILLSEEKFNQALLYYSQIQENLQNNVLSHEASLKSAKTSYFKTDFEWALKQFKELKSANTQLIANDALEYFLLINDNTVADSTQTALKEFAKGDYLLYQNRNQEAITQFQAILKSFKGQEIEAVTLLRLGNVYERVGDYTQALPNYQEIIDRHADGIYVDEALYFSAEIYNKQLKQIDTAKSLYEKIIFNHQDSIYFVDARKKFRELRGDANL